MRDITLIEQPTHNSCTATCLAMMTGLPLDYCMEKFDAGWHDNDVPSVRHNPFTFLAAEGFEPSLNCNPYAGQFHWGSCYLVTVPSLNIEGCLHSIVIDCRCSSEADIRLYDPARVSAGSRVYVMFDNEVEEGKRVLLRSWQLDLSIS